MSLKIHNQPDLITVWARKDDRVGNTTWYKYLLAEQVRLRRMGIAAEIVSMPSVRTKKGSKTFSEIYALQRVFGEGGK